VRARERALDEAMRQAVEQAAATVLDADALVARSSDLRLRIYPKARAYVVNYRVLDESELPSGAFQIHISAQVATGRLSRDIAAPQQKLPAPPPLAGRGRALVCTLPARPGTLDVGGAGEAAVRELLAARGVTFDPKGPPACSEAEAAQAARSSSAQGALIATVEATSAGPIRGSDQMAAHAHVRLQLVEPDGRVSAESDGERDAYDATVERAAAQAARRAGEDAARSMEPHFGQLWPMAQPQGGVRVRLSGCGHYSDYVAVLRALQQLPGVGGVEPRRFGRGVCDLLVRTASPPSQVAGALRRVPPAGVRLTVAETAPDALDVQIAEPAP
jgi:hypothetical protein